MIAIIVSHPRRTTISNVIHAATRVARPMNIVPVIVKESGGLYVDSMIQIASFCEASAAGLVVLVEGC